MQLCQTDESAVLLRLMSCAAADLLQGQQNEMPVFLLCYVGVWPACQWGEIIQFGLHAVFALCCYQTGSTCFQWRMRASDNDLS